MRLLKIFTSFAVVGLALGHPTLATRDDDGGYSPIKQYLYGVRERAKDWRVWATAGFLTTAVFFGPEWANRIYRRFNRGSSPPADFLQATQQQSPSVPNPEAVRRGLLRGEAAHPPWVQAIDEYLEMSPEQQKGAEGKQLIKDIGLTPEDEATHQTCMEQRVSGCTASEEPLLPPDKREGERVVDHVTHQLRSANELQVDEFPDPEERDLACRLRILIPRSEAYTEVYLARLGATIKRVEPESKGKRQKEGNPPTNNEFRLNSVKVPSLSSFSAPSVNWAGWRAAMMSSAGTFARTSAQSARTMPKGVLH
ncbi:MAG: hypothetical protein M1823_005981 [Watsoniomyces obsoletus]|nr:MAG: hypothetical protein M1823_005981 [Watsoniomyces obsoletus]